MNIEVLKAHGIDYDKGVTRFMGESKMYEMVLQAFTEETALERAEEFFKSKDYKNLFATIHEVKGSSGNCDMTQLYNISCTLCDLLRNEDYDESKITPSYAEFKKIYENTIQGIKEAV